MNSVRSLANVTLSTLVTVILATNAPLGLGATVMLGDQDFANGTLISSPGAFLVPQGGEPAPIGLAIGDDFNAPSYSASWTFTYAPGAVFSASTTLGIVDHDSGAAGNQVASFAVDGVDLTAGLNALFEASGGTQIEANVYTLVLGGAALAALSDGSATFTLTLQGPGLQGISGTCCDNITSFNAAGVDFARLDFEQAVVPESGTIALFALGLAGLGCARHARR